MPGEPHVITRARERYGLELTMNDVIALERKIAAGESFLFEKRPRGEIRVMPYAGKSLVLFYGPFPGKPGHIYTFLPPTTVLAGTRRRLYGGTPDQQRSRRRKMRK